MIHEVDALFAKELVKCERSAEEHKVVANAISFNKTLHVRRILFVFPDEMTCSPDLASSLSRITNETELEPDLRTLNTDFKMDDGNIVVQRFQPIFWIVHVDGSERLYNAGKAKAGVDGIAKALQGMKFSS
jgi:hypothetical protein